MSVARVSRRLYLEPAQLFAGAAVVVAEVLAVLLYAARPDLILTDPSILVWPLVWINVGLWAVFAVSAPGGNRRRRVGALAVAAGYFLLLAWFGGLLGVGGSEHVNGLHVNWTLPPGWGPTVSYHGPLTVILVPYKLFGYAVLAYLVYATLLATVGSAVSGVVGLFSCVSCAWPVLGTVVAGLFGSGSVVAAAVVDLQYVLSTVVFVTAVALLAWRPLRNAEDPTP